MARIRTVKPEFYTHYDLFKAEQESGYPLRVAFSGLWLCADKEGRFKWQPEQLKLHILPYDSFDFNQIIEALVFYKFIRKYEVSGKFYGVIPTFKDHQRITGSEANGQSKIPEPEKGNTLETSWKPAGIKTAAFWLSKEKVTSDSFSGIFELETLWKHLGNILDDWKGREGKGREKEGKGEGSDSYAENELCYDIEKYLLERKKDFEVVCLNAQKDGNFVKNVLKKFHLTMVEKNEYPKRPLQLIAGLQKWILNEKNFSKNGQHTTSTTGQTFIPD